MENDKNLDVAAIRALELSASNQVVESQAHLGVVRYFGIPELGRDIDESSRWINQAATAKNVLAMNVLSNSLIFSGLSAAKRPIQVDAGLGLAGPGMKAIVQSNSVIPFKSSAPSPEELATAAQRTERVVLNLLEEARGLEVIGRWTARIWRC